MSFSLPDEQNYCYSNFRSFLKSYSYLSFRVEKIMLLYSINVS